MRARRIAILLLRRFVFMIPILFGVITFTFVTRLRTALPPVATLAGTVFSILIGGAVLVEVIFSWGGAAHYAATAISQSDYPAIQTFVLVAGAVSLFVFLVVDLLYVLIDPRVQL